MASLNLIPNPTVLVVQAGIFLINTVIIKKLFVEPYLTIRDKREALTVGSKDEAARALAGCETLTQQIEARITAVAIESKKTRESLRNAALAKRDAVMAVATKEAKQIIEAVEAQIQSDLRVERAKVPAVVASLTEEVYKLALA